VRKVNGILVPGGGCAFNMSYGIGQSTNEIFQIAKLVNNIICTKLRRRTLIDKYICSESKYFFVH